MPKYEILDETRDYEGTTVYRIRALDDFGDVAAGELGGFIVSGSSLSQDGNCWIYDDSVVMDSSQVMDNARIGKNSVIRGMAVVRGSAVIQGSKIEGAVTVRGTARIINSTLAGGRIVEGDEIIKNEHMDGVIKHIPGQSNKEEQPAYPVDDYYNGQDDSYYERGNTDYPTEDPYYDNQDGPYYEEQENDYHTDEPYYENQDGTYEEDSYDEYDEEELADDEQTSKKLPLWKRFKRQEPVQEPNQYTETNDDEIDTYFEQDYEDDYDGDFGDDYELEDDENEYTDKGVPVLGKQARSNKKYVMIGGIIGVLVLLLVGFMVVRAFLSTQNEGIQIQGGMDELTPAEQELYQEPLYETTVIEESIESSTTEEPAEVVEPEVSEQTVQTPAVEIEVNTPEQPQSVETDIITQENAPAKYQRTTTTYLTDTVLSDSYVSRSLGREVNANTQYGLSEGSKLQTFIDDEVTSIDAHFNIWIDTEVPEEEQEFARSFYTSGIMQLSGDIVNPVGVLNREAQYGVLGQNGMEALASVETILTNYKNEMLTLFNR